MLRKVRDRNQGCLWKAGRIDAAGPLRYFHLYRGTASGQRGCHQSARITSQGPLWLSAVVLEELYAGVSRQGRRIIDRLERDFERAQRILVPNFSDWIETGQVLARLAAEYGYEQIGKGRLTNDALIAVSAGGKELPS